MPRTDHQYAARFIAAHTGIPEATVRVVVAGFMAWLKFKLMRGQSVHLREFGVFRPKWFSERTVTLNLKYAQGPTKIRGHWRIKFGTAKALKALMMKNLPDPTQQPANPQDE